MSIEFVSYHCFGFPSGSHFHSNCFKKTIGFAVSNHSKKVLTEKLHHSQATFLSGTPWQNFEITCSQCSDSGPSQIIGFFGISRNFLGITYFEGISNDFRPET